MKQHLALKIIITFLFTFSSKWITAASPNLSMKIWGVSIPAGNKPISDEIVKETLELYKAIAVLYEAPDFYPPEEKEKAFNFLKHLSFFCFVLYKKEREEQNITIKEFNKQEALAKAEEIIANPAKQIAAPLSINSVYHNSIKDEICKPSTCMTLHILIAKPFMGHEYAHINKSSEQKLSNNYILSLFAPYAPPENRRKGVYKKEKKRIKRKELSKRLQQLAKNSTRKFLLCNFI